MRTGRATVSATDASPATLGRIKRTYSVATAADWQRWGTFLADAADWEWRPPAPVERDGHFIAQAHAFMDQVESRRPAACPLEAGIQTFRFNLAALASAETERRISCAHLS